MHRLIPFPGNKEGYWTTTSLGEEWRRGDQSFFLTTKYMQKSMSVAGISNVLVNIHTPLKLPAATVPPKAKTPGTKKQKKAKQFKLRKDGNRCQKLSAHLLGFKRVRWSKPSLNHTRYISISVFSYALNLLCILYYIRPARFAPPPLSGLC